MVRLRIRRDTEWGEYVVEWLEDGRVDEDKSYYTGGIDSASAADAVYSAIDMIERASSSGVLIGFNKDKRTLGLVERYRPDYLESYRDG